jgi:hypothetical protein
MMAAVRGNGMRKTLLQHLSDQEMNMKVDNRRSTIHAHSQNLADCPDQKDRFSCYQWIDEVGYGSNEESRQRDGAAGLISTAETFEECCHGRWSAKLGHRGPRGLGPAISRNGALWNFEASLIVV